MSSYSNFTLKQIKDELGISNKLHPLFPSSFSRLKASAWLNKALKIAEELPVKSEKARSELIVLPILLELRMRNEKFFTIYSGEMLNVDEAKGLKGECDFIIAKDTQSFDVNLPILQIVEAKKNDIEIGIPQCAAQMIGAKLFNEANGLSLDKIYGCVTTGDNWQFMLLENNEVLIDTKKYYLGNLEDLLGVMQCIIDYYKRILSDI